MVKKEIRVKVASDGTEYPVDLLQGVLDKEEDGIVDLRCSMTIAYDSRGVITGCVVKVAAPSGGVLETADQYLSDANREGYMPSLTWDLTAGGQRAGTTQKRVYVKSRDGCLYAGVKCIIYPGPHFEGLIRLESIANPHASPNLEFDPEKQLKGKQLETLIEEEIKKR